jgi:hypothetical protein
MTLRLNYTTYDVRRDHDLIHVGTSCCNVMALDAEREGCFCYARVLGVFHANVLYLGEGTRDFAPRRLDFLWVRWYTIAEPSLSLEPGVLECVQFPPMASGDAFGFLDPADLIRGCHMIPLFSQGQVHSDRISLSHCVQDGEDWKQYYVNRSDSMTFTFISYDLSNYQVP